MSDVLSTKPFPDPYGAVNGAKVAQSFECDINEALKIVSTLLDGGYRTCEDFGDDEVWLLRADSRSSFLNGMNPVDVASKYSDVSPEICNTKEEYSFGVLFDVAVELSSKLNMPESGKWNYSVKYMDSDAIALCGADRSRTVLFDQPERRTIGVLDTGFGKLQLNSIYDDGVYRFELGSKYPLDGLPDELKDWGVEFDLSIPPDVE